MKIRQKYVKIDSHVKKITVVQKLSKYYVTQRH